MATPVPSYYGQEISQDEQLRRLEQNELANINAILNNVSRIRQELAMPAHNVSIGAIQSIVYEMRQLIATETAEEALLQRIMNISNNMPFKLGAIYGSFRNKAAFVAHVNSTKLINGVYRDIMIKHKMIFGLSQEMTSFENFLYSRDYNSAKAELDRIRKTLVNIEGMIKNIQQRIRRLEKAEVREEHMMSGQVPRLG